MLQFLQTLLYNDEHSLMDIYTIMSATSLPLHQRKRQILRQHVRLLAPKPIFPFRKKKLENCQTKKANWVLPCIEYAQWQ